MRYGRSGQIDRGRGKARLGIRHPVIEGDIGAEGVPTGGTMNRRIAALVSALALFAMLIPLTTGVVLAWSPPSIASVCSTDQAVHNWTITLATESNYGIQWANNSTFTSATTVTMHAGANQLTTPASVLLEPLSNS